MFHVGKNYKKKGERYYKTAPITSHIIVMDTATRTPPMNSSMSLVFSDIVLKILFVNKISILLSPCDYLFLLFIYIPVME